MVLNSYPLVSKLEFEQLGIGSKDLVFITIPSQKISILMVMKEKTWFNIVNISFS